MTPTKKQRFSIQLLEERLAPSMWHGSSQGQSQSQFQAQFQSQAQAQVQVTAVSISIRVFSGGFTFSAIA